VSELTPSQTVGPYFALAVPWPGRTAAFPPETPGRRILIEGRVLDGDGVPVSDALLETWQASPAGRYLTEPSHEPGGLARAVVDGAGAWAIETLMPGPVVGPGGSTQAPHLLVSVFARGLLVRLVTRIYFPDAGDLSADPVLRQVPPARRSTLVASAIAQDRYRFDIVLQGPGETVFFAP